MMIGTDVLVKEACCWPETGKRDLLCKCLWKTGPFPVFDWTWEGYYFGCNTVRMKGVQTWE